MKSIMIFLGLSAVSSCMAMQEQKPKGKEEKMLIKLSIQNKIAKDTGFSVRKHLKKYITEPERLAEVVDPCVAYVGLDHPATAYLEKPSSINWKALAKEISKPGKLAPYVDNETADIGTDSSPS